MNRGGMGGRADAPPAGGRLGLLARHNMREAIRSYWHSFWLCRRTGNLDGVHPRIVSYHRNVIELAPGATLRADGRVHLATRRTTWPGSCFIRLGRNSTLHLGNRVRIRAGCRIVVHNNAHVRIGDGCILQENLWVLSRRRIDIRDGCYLGSGMITDSDLHRIVADGKLLPLDGPVTIGPRVWIGNHSIVLKGVTIGPDTVVGAGSLVSRDLPDHVLAVGRPAAPQRRIDRWGLGPDEVTPDMLAEPDPGGKTDAPGREISAAPTGQHHTAGRPRREPQKP